MHLALFQTRHRSILLAWRELFTHYEIQCAGYNIVDVYVHIKGRNVRIWHSETGMDNQNFI